MNKLSKIGCSALCGSLAAISAANAGALDVTGGATVTHTQNTTATTGNAIGMNSGLTFTGTGELDGGQTFTYSLALTDGAAYSATNIDFVTNSIGTFKVDQAGGGNGIGGHDDVTPTAWEESWGAGLGAGIDFAKGVGSSVNIGWTLPEMMGSTIKLAYTPRHGGTVAADKNSGGDGGAKGMGYDVMLDLNTAYAMNLPNIFVGGSRSERNDQGGSGSGTKDHEEVVVGFKYVIGPVTLGAQTSGEFTGSSLGGETEYYHNRGYGISFNVNDNLSLSYGEYNSRRGFTGKSTSINWQTARDMRETEARSFQVAYTMGGMSLQWAENSVDDASYTSGTASDSDGSTLALTLAF